MLENFTNAIEFQMSLLLFVALLGYYLASRINQSVVVGEIIVGMLIGPSLLNIITYRGFVEGLAHLGAVVLLFVIGLEFRFSSIYKFKYLIIALVGVIVPWIGGFLFAKYSQYDFNTSIFIGTALTATSIAITANVLKEMGKLKTKAAEAIIGAAVIDDILGLLVLSISNQIVLSQVTFVDNLLIVLKVFVFLVIGSFIGNGMIRSFIVRLDEHHISKKYPEMAFIFAMMIAFLYSIVAEVIGLSAIVGAFLAGASLSGLKIKHSRGFHEGAEYIQIIFASIFFVSLGILIDLHQVKYSYLGFILALTAVAVITKVIGCYIASRLQNISHEDSIVIGFGMSPRGEVAMIVALIGLTKSIITQEVYTALIFMSILTTILAPIILRNWLVNDVNGTKTPYSLG
jgi:Kef-type K+ transport system membrane component KefB